jgi:endonuclease-8
MPEGPEVKRLVDKINKKYKNKNITNIKILNGKYLKKPIKNINEIKYPLVIEKICCKGKFIYWLFKNTDIVMFNTLGMTGWWVENNNNFSLEKHNNVLFKIDGKNVFFNDFRNFGNIIFCYRDNLDKKLKELGPDILYDDVELFLQRIEKKRSDTLIATALLDQKVACGCGNYLRAEVLYLCKISPYREIDKMTNNELKLLWLNLKKLGWYYYNENKAIKLNIINNTFIKKIEIRYKKYGPSNYKPDEYTFMVYRQNIDPLGNKVISKKIKDRMIHYVPKIQK